MSTAPVALGYAFTICAVLPVLGCQRGVHLREGGTELVLVVEAPPGVSAEQQSALAETVRAVLARRIERAGAEGALSADGLELRVLLPASGDLQRTRELVTARGSLELREVDERTMEALAGRIPLGLQLARTTDPSFQGLSLIAANEERARSAPAMLAPLLPPGVSVGVQPPGGVGHWVVLALGPVLATTVDVADAKASLLDGVAIVNVRLRPEPARAFEDATNRLVGRRIAVVLDGTVLLAPWVAAPIPRGRVQITLGSVAGRSQEALFGDAKHIAGLLSAGAPLPAPVRVVRERAVPAAR